MRLKVFKSTMLTSVLAFSFALTPVVAFAEHGAAESGTTTDTSQTDGTAGTSDSSSSGKSGDTSTTDNNSTGDTTDSPRHSGEHGQNKLAANRLRVCKLHAMKVNMIMDRIVMRGTRQTELFSTIATRVEDFYTDKGKTLANYDQLVTAVNDAKTKAQTDLDALKNQGTFNCDGSDPKGAITEFRTALKTEIQDLKAFRTAVKNLIVGVKSVTGTTNSGDNTSTDSGSGTGGTE